MYHSDIILHIYIFLNEQYFVSLRPVSMFYYVSSQCLENALDTQGLNRHRLVLGSSDRFNVLFNTNAVIAVNCETRRIFQCSSDLSDQMLIQVIRVKDHHYNRSFYLWFNQWVPQKSVLGQWLQKFRYSDKLFSSYFMRLWPNEVELGFMFNRMILTVFVSWIFHNNRARG